PVALEQERHRVAARDDVRRDGAIEQEPAVRDGEPPERRAEVGELVAAPDVVDHDVELALLALDLRAERLDLRLDGVVDLYGDAAPSARADHLRGLLDGLGARSRGGSAADAPPGAVDR